MNKTKKLNKLYYKMGFFHRIGKKIADAYETGHRIGSKVLGEASRIGHKVVSVGRDVVKTIEGIPILSTALATPLSIAKKGLAMVDKGASFADRGSGLLKDVDFDKLDKKIDFEASLQKLEAIVSKLEDENINLEDSVKSFEAGINLVKECQKQLEEAELKVKELLDDGTAQELDNS